MEKRKVYIVTMFLLENLGVSCFGQEPVEATLHSCNKRYHINLTYAHAEHNLHLLPIICVHVLDNASNAVMLNRYICM